MGIDLNNNPLFGLGQQQEEEKQEPKKRKVGRPRKSDIVRGNSVQEGLTEDYTRATFIVKVELLEKLRNYAWTERKEMKTVINEILEKALTEENERMKKEYGYGILDRNKRG